MSDPGVIVVLNGAPRSGKSTIARAIQDAGDGMWLNLGVDAFCEYVTPARLMPGIGLRPGGERPDLEAHLPALFDALYGSVVALSLLGSTWSSMSGTMRATRGRWGSSGGWRANWPDTRPTSSASGARST